MSGPPPRTPRTVRRPRLVATDLDGTLLRSDNTLSARNRDALRAAAAAGAVVVLATGRPPESVVRVLTELGPGVARWLVAGNGSGVFHVDTDDDGRPAFDVRHQVTFPRPLADAAVAVLRRQVRGIRFSMMTEAGFGHEDGFGLKIPDPPPALAEVARVEDVPGVLVRKLFAFHPELHVLDYLDAMQPHLPEGVHAQHLGIDAAEVGPVGVNKAAALGWLCRHVEIDAADVVAFGDQLNDIEMLAWAGLGVAMANAPGDVASVADRIGPHHDDDGVAVVLEEILGGIAG